MTIFFKDGGQLGPLSEEAIKAFGADVFLHDAEAIPDLPTVVVVPVARAAEETVLRLKDEFPRSALFVVTTGNNSDQDPVDALTVGADASIASGADLKVMAAYLEALYNHPPGFVHLAKAPVVQLRSDSLDINLLNHCVVDRRSGEEVELQPNDYRLLLFMALNGSKTISREEFFEEFWDGVAPDGNVLDTYMSRLRKTLRGVSGNGGADRVIVTVRGVGYGFSEDVEKSKVILPDFGNPDALASGGPKTISGRALAPGR